MSIIHISGDDGDDVRAEQSMRAGAAAGIFRQCSLGWHEECSDPYGEECRCRCHIFPEWTL